MKYAKPVVIALLLMLLDPLAPILVLLALPFVRWDEKTTADSMGAYMTVRGDLPKWASWLGTPNERLPGGTYEPTVLDVLLRFGKYACSWYWLVVRNRWYGLAAVFGKPIARPWPVEPGYYEDGDLWYLRYPVGRFQFKAGYRVYAVGGLWSAVPCCTVTKA